TAKLISENEDGVVTSSFSLSITGLTAGVYDLSIIKKSDGSTVDLGQFTIGQRHHEDDGEDQDEQGDNDEQGDDDNHDDQGSQFAASLDKVPLPPGLDPMDIAQILISDSTGTILLTGDLVDPAPATTVKFAVKVRVRSASGASVTSTSNNKAQALSTVKRGKRTDRFTMVASGLAPNTTLTVMVNGQNAGTIKTNGKGKALVRRLPVNLLIVRSIHLVD